MSTNEFVIDNNHIVQQELLYQFVNEKFVEQSADQISKITKEVALILQQYRLENKLSNYRFNTRRLPRLTIQLAAKDEEYVRDDLFKGFGFKEEEMDKFEIKDRPVKARLY
jgi:hypothetical protein